MVAKESRKCKRFLNKFSNPLLTCTTHRSQVYKISSLSSILNFVGFSRLKDVHVFRGVAAGMSDHFLVEAKVVVVKEWGNRVVGCSREVVKVEESKKKNKKKNKSTRTG